MVSSRSPQEPGRRSLAVPLGLVAILIVAAIIRVPGLEDCPPGFFIDEAAVGVNALLIAEAGIDQYGNTFPVLFRALDDYKCPLYIYATAVAVRVAGLSEVAVRLPAAVFGLLGIALSFWVARAVLGSDRYALAAAALLCLSPWHVQFSRMGWQAITMTVTYPIAILFAVRSLRKPTWLAGGLAGLFLALTLYTYSPAKLLVAATVPIVLASLCCKLNERSSCLVAFLVAFVAIAVPFGVSYLTQARYVNLRFHELLLPVYEIPQAYISYFTPRFLFGSANENELLVTPYGLEHVCLAPLLIAGVLALLFDRALPKYPLWILLGVPLLGSLSEGYPHPARVITLLPWFHVIVVLGLKVSLEYLRNHRRLQAVVACLFTGCMVLSSYLFLVSYFREYAVQSQKSWSYGRLAALRRLEQEAKPEEEIYLFGVHYVDWMFVDPPNPDVIREHRTALQQHQERYDHFDLQKKYRFLRPHFIPSHEVVVGSPGIWFLPKERYGELDRSRRKRLLHLELLRDGRFFVIVRLRSIR